MGSMLENVNFSYIVQISEQLLGKLILHVNLRLQTQSSVTIDCKLCLCIPVESRDIKFTLSTLNIL